MTAPTMEQMLDELIARYTAFPLGAGSLAKAEEARAALLARFAELERERDEAREGWHMANGVADLAMKHRNRAEALLRKLHPYVDSLICYASTLDEHEGNRIAKDVNDYFADDTIFDAAIAQRAGETG